MNNRNNKSKLDLSPLSDFAGVFIWLIAASLICLYLLSGCANLASHPAEFPKDPSKFYRRDMEVIVDGVSYPGYGTLPLKDSYAFEVLTKHDMDRFSATNCHKQLVEEKVDGTNLFKKTAKYKFTYKRVTEIEREDPCVLEMVASDEGNEHTWAFFDFQDSKTVLPATVVCDGWVQVYNGVSVCQAKAGLTQEIKFEEAVVTDDEGPKLPTKDHKTFTFEMPKGRNVFMFCSRKSLNCHRFTTLGYDEAWLRGVK